jgi:plastocyanin
MGRFALAWLIGVLGFALAGAPALAAGHTHRHAHKPAAPSTRTPAAFHTGGPATIQQVQYPAGVERLHYKYGPIFVTPGANLIVVGQKTLPKPNENGYLVGLVPNLVLANGKVPPTDVLHLHHGVWLNTGASDTSSGNVPYERFFATGEEKTQLHLPAPYGYPVHASDTWLMNYMIHNLTTRSYVVYLTYEVDFVPQFSPLGQTMRPVRPIWMDIQNGEAYPVFNALHGTGTNGRYTYPDQDPSAYSGQAPKNQWTVDRPGTLVATAGHLHPGGLYDDLDLIRPGASVATGPPGQPAPVPGAEPNSVRLFRSSAHYWDPRGPISWDLAMSATTPSWRVGVKPGDVLRVSTTYDTHSASWYEAMGIMVVWMADDTSGPDPFSTALDTNGEITHGRLPENVDSGGAMSIGLPDPRRLPNGPRAPHDTIDIKNFTYLDGGYGDPGKLADPPTVKTGQSLQFVNEDNTRQIFHTITACKAPCMLNGGISYPLANGPVGFDSGQLGTGTPGFTAAANRITWKTPANLPPGTYTYFCRVHPFMRGTFRVVSQ